MKRLMWHLLGIIVSVVVLIGSVLGFAAAESPHRQMLEDANAQLEKLENTLFPLVRSHDDQREPYLDLSSREELLRQKTDEVETLWRSIPPGTHLGHTGPGHGQSVRSWESLVGSTFTAEGSHASVIERIRTVGQEVFDLRHMIPELQRSIARQRMTLGHSAQLDELIAQHARLTAQRNARQTADEQWRQSLIGAISTWLKWVFGACAMLSGVAVVGLVFSCFDPNP